MNSVRTESFKNIDLFQNQWKDGKRHEEKVHKYISGINLVNIFSLKCHLFLTAKSAGHF